MTGEQRPPKRRWPRNGILAVVVAATILSCVDKAAPALKDCETLRNAKKFDDAIRACGRAVTADSASKAGKAAAVLRTEISKIQKDQEARQAFNIWDGIGVTKDQPAARKMFEAACKGGSPIGCAGLGISFLDGVGGTDRDYDKALANLASTCAEKIQRACAALAYMNLSGHGTAKDEAKAAMLYREACDGDEPRGCSGLGVMYGAGAGGLPKDEPKAVSLFTKACDANLPWGCWALSNAYYMGLGVGKSFDYAAKYGAKACDGGDGDGCLRLAVAHAQGKGAKKDEKAALELAQKSCDLVSSQGCVLLASMYGAGQGTSADNAKAATYYEKACDLSNGDGCYAFATFTRHGWGVTANPVVADNLLRKACELGSASACKEFHR